MRYCWKFYSNAIFELRNSDYFLFQDLWAHWDIKPLYFLPIIALFDTILHLNESGSFIFIDNNCFQTELINKKHVLKIKWQSMQMKLLIKLTTPESCHGLLSMLKDKYSCILGVIILLCSYPVTPLIRTPDKWGIEDISMIIFLISQWKHMLWPLIRTVSTRRF